MTGRASPILAATAVALALAAPARAGAEAGPPTVAGLLAELAALPGLEARFREEKRIALLVSPLVSEGTIHFAPPGRMARHTTSPAPASVVVSDGALSFGAGGEAERIDLASSPTVRLFVESFVAILAGDRAALERMYAITIAPAGEGWELRLLPRPAPMRRVIREVRVAGRGAVIERIHVLEVSGDETVTTFSGVDTARRYSEAEARRVFRVAPSR